MSDHDRASQELTDHAIEHWQHHTLDQLATATLTLYNRVALRTHKGETMETVFLTLAREMGSRLVQVMGNEQAATELKNFIERRRLSDRRVRDRRQKKNENGPAESLQLDFLKDAEIVKH